MDGAVMSLVAYIGLGVLVGLLAAEARRSLGWAVLWFTLAMVPVLLFAPAGMLRPKVSAPADVTDYRRLSGVGIHTFITTDSIRTVFVWDGVVNDSTYIVGMRPVRSIVYVTSGNNLDTLRLSGN